jgi:hypothetical protein
MVVTEPSMSPGGHLVTTVAACTAALALTRTMPVGDSLALAAGLAAGGFFIDVDHAVDYVLFEGQRDLRPGAFLRYYLEGRMRRVVLVLHSYELFAILAWLAWWSGSIALTGYLLGALMHLGLDIVFNGEQTPRSIGAFYSFGYRARHGFDAHALFGSEPRAVPGSFWAAFFMGARMLVPVKRVRPRGQPMTVQRIE